MFQALLRGQVLLKFYLSKSPPVSQASDLTDVKYSGCVNCSACLFLIVKHDLKKRGVILSKSKNKNVGGGINPK